MEAERMKDEEQLELKLPRQVQRDPLGGHALRCVLVVAARLLIARPAALRSVLVELIHDAVALSAVPAPMASTPSEVCILSIAPSPPASGLSSQLTFASANQAGVWFAVTQAAVP